MVCSAERTFDPSALKDLRIDVVEFGDDAYELADFDIWVVEHLVGAAEDNKPRCQPS